MPKVVVSIMNQVFQIVDAEKAFGSDFPPEYKPFLIQGTADDIATLMLMKDLEPIMIAAGKSTDELIRERRRGLEALGVQDIDSEIDMAVDRLRALGSQALADRAILFMS